MKGVETASARVISANGKMYDHASSFAKNGLLNWRQNNTRYCIGNIVYIYCTKPLSRVMFRCVVEKEGISFSETVDDREFRNILEEHEKAKVGRYVRIRLLTQVDTPLLDFNHLKAHRLKAALQCPGALEKSLVSISRTILTTIAHLAISPTRMLLKAISKAT